MFDPSKFTIPKAKPLPVIFLIDISGSMGEVIDETGMQETGETVYDDGKLYRLVTGGVSRIQLVNDCCKKMITSFSASEKLETEIDVAIITFGAETKIHQKLQPASSIQWTDMEASGETPLGQALIIAKNMIEDRNQVPGRAYRPAVILISDGRPDFGWENPLADFIGNGRSAKCDRMAMAIGDDADINVLSKFIEGTGHQVFSADDADKIQDFFNFVTMSVTTRSLSKNPNLVNTQQPSLDGASISNASADEDDSYF